MLNLNDMHLFVEVVQAGGYSAAARALGIPTSKLSRHIADLEQSLGVRLLNRTTRKISTTDVGQTFYQHCVGLVEAAHAAREAIEKTRSEPYGTIRVSCPIGLLPNRVANIVTQFLADHPQVRIELEATNRRVDVIEERIDVALRVRTAPPQDSELVVRPLARSQMALVGSPALLKSLGHPVTVADLSRFPTLAMTCPGEKHVWQFQKEGKDVEEHGHVPRLATDDFSTLHDAAAKGLGITCLPEFMAETALRAGVLERVLPELSLPQGTVQVVFSSRRGMVPAVRAFVDALVTGYSPNY
jgi:DNA-binding transcriptional LysR family regulator